MKLVVYLYFSFLCSREIHSHINIMTGVLPSWHQIGSDPVCMNELNQVLEYKYRGMWVIPNGCEKVKNEKICLANQWVGRLGSAARMRASKYDVLRYGRVWLCLV